MSLFRDSYSALICNDADEKIYLTNQLIKYQKKDKGPVLKVKKMLSPGRPIKPKLVSFNGAPKRDNSDLGICLLYTSPSPRDS